ncbi:hypothetical protein NC99_15130 [Sunxiuqinia dokdonensis]|uniref:Uncharacterized protein n=1 Tax=Sunxiuqinia dokdonensis TaxID=1409788 RepID=A0A0L8VB32_9BACT|nr:hypothetical protein NC99_15130 [Sunxiuqinia dokdonensis]
MPAVNRINSIGILVLFLIIFRFWFRKKKIEHKDAKPQKSCYPVNV